MREAGHRYTATIAAPARLKQDDEFCVASLPELHSKTLSLKRAVVSKIVGLPTGIQMARKYSFPQEKWRLAVGPGVEGTEGP